ncbi:leukotriene-B4 omega-hydroxylase 3-like [Ptychodera flava]|uniref:leukotriene-B4 omega-hydroxylase 3-like n=1 Tax=Ptychodera flava TaxID=63121 RepID=UPI00396A10B3
MSALSFFRQAIALPEKVTVSHYVRLLWWTVCLFVAYRILAKFIELMRRKWRIEKDLAAFPSPERHWLLGHLKILSQSEEAYRTMENDWNGEKYSPARVSWAGPFIAGVVCIHPSSVKAILTTTEPKDEIMYGFLRPWLGDGLLISTGKKWHRNRRLLTPGFHFDILKPYVKVFNDCSKTLMNNWSDLCKSSGSNTATLELFEHISLMTLDSLLKCIFGQDSYCQTDRNNPYIQGVYELSNLLVKRATIPPYQNDLLYSITPSGYKFRQVLKIVHGFAWKVINDRKAALAREEKEGKKNTRKYVDFLDILLSARDEHGQGLTDQEIKDEVDTFMFEGHDTTASGISWFLYNLARNPKYQQQCREEVNEILAAKELKEIEWEDLGKLTNLTLCLKESMRLNTPVPAVARTIDSPLPFPDGRTIPEGYRVVVSINALHHNPLVWKDPDVFDPSRFTPENSKDRSPYAYVPFSAGPRNCIGQNFAMNEMKITAAMVLHHFDLELVESFTHDRKMGMTLKSENGLMLRIKKRGQD